jgi:hypothetical protein
LRGLTMLQEIDLRGTQVTDTAPLASLSGCMIITRSSPRVRRRR